MASHRRDVGVGDVAERLKFRIRTEGPVSVAVFMAEVVTAYYAQAEPFGIEGDFITAPDVSQVFGELLGLWAVSVWQDMGAPQGVRLVELGPGRGTLMVDLLRAAQTAVPAFAMAVHVHLVETSLRLATIQKHRLEGTDLPLAWHNCLENVPPGPLLIVANEFLDALPIRQFERTPDGWRERLVGLAADGKAFRFVLGAMEPKPPLPAHVQDEAPLGAIAEGSTAVQSTVASVAARLLAHGGAALFIDYGPSVSAAGDSLQAVRNHASHPVLEAPGKADLTAHVDFAVAAAIASQLGVRVCGPLCQGKWLRRLGILARANQLLTQATPQQAWTIVTGVQRLIDDNAMGRLFKVLGLAHPSLLFLPGLNEKG